ncbi:MAG: phosphopantothenate/pantothenate synthetase [Candidatus Thermoplasmatota archaeon]|nr:phosphopantothenate/pantothenate synthetase [Candidatus Thermoplasmatota archaeon]
MKVPESHPRYLSLITRDRLVDGWKKGLVATQGLIAHGRGEAFDYLLGETTTKEAEAAELVASYMLVTAKKPVISVNGNVGALVPDGIAALSDLLSCPVEVNIFHRTEDRVRRLAQHLEDHGCRKVLGEHPDSRLEGLDHARALCTRQGILNSDVVLVPLEDGDRCQALRSAGKKVITIDLNPLSRTARTANVTIVNNLTRSVPNLIEGCRVAMEALSMGRLTLDDVEKEIASFSNEVNLMRVLGAMIGRYASENMSFE